MDSKKSQKVAKDYCCLICDYSSCNKTDYSKHVATDKHKINTMEVNGSDMEVQKVANFVCNCSRVFNTHGGLWKHKQKCTNNNTVNSNILEFQDNVKVDMNDPNLIIEILKQNQDFKQLIIDQNKTIMEQTL